MQQHSNTLEIILARFDGQVLIPLVDACKVIGMSIQTARNQLVNGNFPIPTVLRGNRRFVHVSDLAAYVDSIRNLVSPKAKRGRKSKASKMQAIQSNAGSRTLGVAL